MKITIDKPQAIWQLGKRDNQEDNIYPAFGNATDSDRLFILCDGMGGHEHGEVASRIVSTTMGQYISSHADFDAPVPDEVLTEALNAAYLELDKADTGGLRKMGTTVCLLLFHKGGLTAMHVGDSRIYHLRPSSPRIIYQSRDHSLVYDLYQAGEISYDEMRTSPKKNVITRALQPGEENRVKPAIVHIASIQPGDYFYVCSDGMLEHTNNEELQQFFAAKTTLEEKREQLVADTANNNDNHSAYLIHITGVSLEEGDDQLVDDEQTSRDNAINIVPAQLEDAVDVDSNMEGDVDVVAEPATNHPLKTDGKKKNQWIPLIVAAIIAVVVIVAFSLGRNDGKKDSISEQPSRQYERGPRQIERPRHAKDDLNARKVNVKATKKQPTKTEAKAEASEQKEKASETETGKKGEEKKKQQEEVDITDIQNMPLPEPKKEKPEKKPGIKTKSL